jgi:acyl-homoserine-lactone acylase
MTKETEAPFAFMMIQEHPVPIDLAVSSIEKAKKLLLQKYGTLDLPLGNVQRHIRGDVSIPASGGFEVLRAADAKLFDKRKGIFRIKGGDGYIQMVKYSKENGAEIESINAYGASANEGSKHFTDQMQMFQNEQFRKMTFDKEIIFKTAEKIYSPGDIEYR